MESVLYPTENRREYLHGNKARTKNWIYNFYKLICTEIRHENMKVLKFVEKRNFIIIHMIWVEFV